MPRCDSIRVRPVLDLRSSRGTLFSNPTQVCILECIGVLQAVAEDAVEAGVAEQERPCEHQPGSGKQETQTINRHRESLVVDQVIGPRADLWIRQIAEHAQVWSQKQERKPAPSVIQTGKKKQRQTE